MRDVVNPFLLLVVVVLIACRTAFSGTTADTCDLWAIVVCGTAFVVDFSLGLARAMVHRPSLMKIVWAIVFLLVGCVVFLFPNSGETEVDPETAEFRALISQYRKEPAFVQGEKVHELVLLAASSGKEHLLRELLQIQAVIGNKTCLSVALQAAAEKGQLSAAELLIPHVALNEPVQGSTPLVAAASVGKSKVVERLLTAGADPNLADAEGTAPIIHAVLADSIPCVRLLMQHGADPSRCDADGRNAASYSRNEEIDALLSH